MWRRPSAKPCPVLRQGMTPVDRIERLIEAAQEPASCGKALHAVAAYRPETADVAHGGIGWAGVRDRCSLNEPGHA